MTTVAVPSIFITCCSSHGTTSICCTARLGPTIPGSCVMMSENTKLNLLCFLYVSLKINRMLTYGVKALYRNVNACAEIKRANEGMKTGVGKD